MLREAIVVVMGADFAVETMVDPSATDPLGRSIAYASGRAGAHRGAVRI